MAQVSLPSRKRPRIAENDSRCAACIGLFSSQGLEELQSEDGYAHRTRQEAEASAKEGCALCDFLVQVGKTKFGKDKFEKYKWSAGDRLVFYQSEPENQASTLTRLRGRIKGSDEVLTIYPFTQEGKTLIHDFPRTCSCLIRIRGSSRNTHPATTSTTGRQEPCCLCRRPEAHPCLSQARQTQRRPSAMPLL